MKQKNTNLAYFKDIIDNLLLYQKIWHNHHLSAVMSCWYDKYFDIQYEIKETANSLYLAIKQYYIRISDHDECSNITGYIQPTHNINICGMSLKEFEKQLINIIKTL